MTDPKVWIIAGTVAGALFGGAWGALVGAVAFSIFAAICSALSKLLGEPMGWALGGPIAFAVATAIYVSLTNHLLYPQTILDLRPEGGAAFGGICGAICGAFALVKQTRRRRASWTEMDVITKASVINAIRCASTAACLLIVG